MSLDPNFDHWLQELIAYRQKYGDCLVPIRPGPNWELGIWVNTLRLQKRYYDRGDQASCLDAGQIATLEKLGFDWDADGRNGGVAATVSPEVVRQSEGTQHSAKRSLGDTATNFSDMTKTLNENIANENSTNNESAAAMGFSDDDSVEESTASNEQSDDDDEDFQSASDWNRCYKELKCHMRSFYPNGGFVASGGCGNEKLGDWVVWQRYQYRNKKLIPERIARLEELGFLWEEKSERKEAEDMTGKSTYRARLPGVATAHSISNADSTRNESAAAMEFPDDDSVEESTASNEQSDDDDEDFQSASNWDLCYKELKSHMKSLHPNGGFVECSECESEKLGDWVAWQRFQYKIKQLSPERIARLEKIGFLWKEKDETEEAPANAMTGKSPIQEYLSDDESNDDYSCNPNSQDEDGPDPNLDNHSDSDGDLSQSKSHLDENDSDAESNEENGDSESPTAFDRHFEKLKRYMEAHHPNGGYVEQSKVSPLLTRRWMMKLRWMYRHRKAGNKTKLTAAQIRKLESIGFWWEKDRPIAKKKGNLAESSNQNAIGKTLHTEHTGTMQTGKQQLRRERQSTSLTKTFQSKWDQNYEKLVSFMKEHYPDGGYVVPPTEDFQFRKWVWYQRAEYNKRAASKRSSLSDYRLEKLEKIGFLWEEPAAEDENLDEDDHSNSSVNNETGESKARKQTNKKIPWETNYRKLVRFMKKHNPNGGYVRPPSSDKKFYNWVCVQRCEFRKRCMSRPVQRPVQRSGLSDDQFEKLLKLGFRWQYEYPDKKKEKSKESVKEDELESKMEQDPTSSSSDEEDESETKDSEQTNQRPTWDTNYEKLVSFMKRYYPNGGFVRAPKSDRKFANWVRYQRCQYRKRSRSKRPELTDDRVEKMEKLGFLWEEPCESEKSNEPDKKDESESEMEEHPSSEEEVESENENDESAKSSESEEDNPSMSDSDGEDKDKPGRDQRSSSRDQVVKPDRRYEHSKTVEKKIPWETHYEKLVRFMRKHYPDGGYVRAPTSDKKFAVWVRVQRCQYRKRCMSLRSQLTDDQFDKLLQLGFCWENPDENENTNAPNEEDESAEGKMEQDPPSKQEDESENEDNESDKDSHSMSDSNGQEGDKPTRGKRNSLHDQIAKPKRKQAMAESNRTPWETNYQKLVRFMKKHNPNGGYVRPPTTTDKKFYSWVTLQRSHCRKRSKSQRSELSDDQFEKLKKLGFSWQNPDENKKSKEPDEEDESSESEMEQELASEQDDESENEDSESANSSESDEGNHSMSDSSEKEADDQSPVARRKAHTGRTSNVEAYTSKTKKELLRLLKTQLDRVERLENDKVELQSELQACETEKQGYKSKLSKSEDDNHSLRIKIQDLEDERQKLGDQNISLVVCNDNLRKSHIKAMMEERSHIERETKRRKLAEDQLEKAKKLIPMELDSAIFR